MIRSNGYIQIKSNRFLLRRYLSQNIAAPKAQAGPSSGNSIKGRRKFYKEATVHEDEPGKFIVKLDGRTLNTPWKNKLVVPNEALALSVAHEWNFQNKTIEPASMPMMTLVCSTLDGAEANKAHIIKELMRFLDTDTVLFHSPADEGDRVLARLQTQIWTPLVDWMKTTYGPVSLSSDVAIDEHPEETKEKVEQFLYHLNPWHLTATESLVAGCKSIIIPLALHNGFIDAKGAIRAARLEEEHQVDAWGLVEGGHDVDRANLAAQVAAASFLIRLT